MNSYVRTAALSFIFLLFCTDATTTVHEVTQQGPLYGFKSYNDVTTFHYIIPREVSKATWRFAAFMDDKDCTPRQVHIHLRWGSYPIISLNNGTFPPNMYFDRGDTIVVSGITTYETEAAIVVPITSPEPGDWFVGAYLSPWDKKILQEGIGRKCHYSIGSVGIWLQENGIKKIPIGYKKSVKTERSSTYFKFFISSGTRSFRVTVSDFYFTLQSRSKFGIRGFVLQGRTLPTFNYSHPSSIQNIVKNNNYSFTEWAPYEDSYYYLLVESDSVVQFNIHIYIFECPLKITETYLIPYWLPNMNYSLHFESSPGYENLLEFENEKNYLCPLRFQLIRVKLLKKFHGSYLFYDQEQLTPWIMLSDMYTVIAQFNIISLVDIGGSLDIEMHLDPDKFLTRQEVMVIACIRRGRVPDNVKGQIICDNQYTMNVSSVNKHEGNLLIPYPQPDTWYIVLQVECFSDRNPVRCDISSIPVSLSIQTRQCVFPGLDACGRHGMCEEINQGFLHYTTCSCFDGYKGWGCTDATDSTLQSSRIWTSLILIISNLFFLPAIYLAMKRKLYTEALVYLATMLFSSFYHACDQKSMQYCIAKYEILQYSDFFSGILAFWVTLVAMAQLNLHLVSFFHMVGVLIIAIGVESNRTGLLNILIPLIIGVLMLIGNYIYRCYKLEKWKWPQGILKLCAGLLLVILSLILFTMVETESNYQYVHSIWHITIALSLIFLLPSAPIKLQSDAIHITMGTPSSDSELLDVNSESNTPIFIVNNRLNFLSSGSQ